MNHKPVYSIPFTSGSNPYITEINRSLARMGVEVFRPTPVIADLVKLPDTNAILHFHWPERIYAATTIEELPASVQRWCDFLHAAKQAGFKIVWTVHNQYPHETSSREWERVAQRRLAEMADRLIVHCRAGLDMVDREYGMAAKCSILPHPCYEIGQEVAVTRPRRPDRAATDPYTLLMFGMLRRYKGIEFALRAIRKVNAPVRLVVAGPPHKSFDTNSLENLVAGDEQVTLIVREVPTGELGGLFCEADAVVFCYSNVLSSGSVALAQSFGKPIIAPRLGCLPEMVPAEAGRLYKAGCEDAFAQAIDEVLQQDLDALGRASREAVRRQTPDSFATTLAEIYRSF
jgi:glycosyltransferase involved in cell wall biosynthesis